MRLNRLAATYLLSIVVFTGASATSPADTLTVVALGASNTSGWGVGAAAAYPARLEKLLRERGHDVQVINAGRAFDTTNGMLGRLDSAVSPKADLVVIQPGGNDLRFFGTRERRAANIDAMRSRLTERGIKALVYDPVFPVEAYQWDRIHINADWHGRIAAELLPQVLDALVLTPASNGRSEPEPRSRNKRQR